jgi:DNA-binding IclR family transcriptional regulator
MCATQRQALRTSAFSAADLARVRARGWAHSQGQREPGVASISAPVHAPGGAVVAAVSLSGPLDRLTKPTKAQVAALLDASARLSAAG